MATFGRSRSCGAAAPGTVAPGTVAPGIAAPGIAAPGTAARLLLTLVASSALLAACSGTGPASSTGNGRLAIATVRAPSLSSNTVPAFYSPPNPLPPGPSGSLLRAERVTGVPTVPPNARIWRILYRSRSIHSSDIAVSGYVAAPAASAPPGGYPMIAWAHGTSGMANVCAPSLFTNLDGQSLYLAPYLSSYLSAGYVVAASDYQGLGTPGIHPYLVGESEGRGVLDAALAAGHLPGLHVSRDVVIVGHSQGGQAALFAGELAPSYAPALHVEGVVAVAPATNLALAVAAVGSLSSNGGITSGQGDLDFIAMALWAWSHTYRNLPVSSLFTPLGVAKMAVTNTGCLPQIATALAGVSAGQLLHPGLTSDPALLSDAALNNAGLVRTDVPMLVVQGTGDKTVPDFLTEYFVDKQACPVGDRVDLALYPGATHSGVLAVARQKVLAWVARRFAGKPAATTCARSAPPA